MSGRLTSKIPLYLIHKVNDRVYRAIIAGITYSKQYAVSSIRVVILPAAQDIFSATGIIASGPISEKTSVGTRVMSLSTPDSELLDPMSFQSMSKKGHLAWGYQFLQSPPSSEPVIVRMEGTYMAKTPKLTICRISWLAHSPQWPLDRTKKHSTLSLPGTSET